jgi:hypothetical protein
MGSRRKHRIYRPIFATDVHSSINNSGGRTDKII